MKRTVLIITGILLVFCHADSAESLDLDAYLSLVVAHSRDLHLADRDRAIADAQKHEAMAGALPTILVEGGYVRNFTDTYMFISPGVLSDGEDGGDGGGGDIKLKVSRRNEFSAAAVLDQVIFSPAVIHGIRGAKQYRQITDFMYEASYQAIITQAKEIFYQAVLCEKVLEVRVAAEHNAAENYAGLKSKFENGLVSEFALLQAEVRWKNTIPDTSKARRDYELVMNNVRTMAGIPVQEKVNLELSLDEYPAMAETMDVEASLARRPDYNALVMEEKLRETGVKANRAAYYPTLHGSLAGAYSVQSDEWSLDRENTIWSGSLSLSIPVFMGGATRARTRKAAIDLEKTRISIEKARDDISNELANIFLWMKEARERIASAEATLSSAEKAFRIAETTSRSGLATQLELKDARLGLDEARLNRYLAIYDYMVARFEWDMATGAVGLAVPPAD